MGELFTPAHLVLILLLAVPVLGIHFVPIIVAGIRRARNFWWIFLINLLFAWTLVGWVIALVWAIRDDTDAYAVARPPMPPPPYNR